MKVNIQEVILNEINADETERIAGGQPFLLEPIELRNVINYYINFLPFTYRNYIEIKREITQGWRNMGNSTNSIFERTIKETLTQKDLKWSNLNKSEKIGVLTPAMFFTFVFASTAVCAVSRYLKGSN